MKELELTLKVRNNRLKERRDALGLNGREFAARVGVSYTTYMQLESMARPPLRKSRPGREDLWIKAAKDLAKFYGCTTYDLFPAAVLLVKTTTATKKVDADEMRGLIGPIPESMKRLALPPDVVFEEAELKAKLADLFEILNVRETRIVRARFGLDDSGPMTLDEVGETEGIHRERVRQIEVMAFRKLRDRYHSRHVKTFFTD
jgi:transcriptional regulator with XRE-family HTH domain